MVLTKDTPWITLPTKFLDQREIVSTNLRFNIQPMKAKIYTTLGKEFQNLK